MSELLGGGGNGRAANGGARAAQGPVPVVPVQQRQAGVRTPRDIWQQRQAREAQRLADDNAKQAEQRQQEEDRRRSAERRAPAAAAGGAGPTRETRVGTTTSRTAGDGGYGEQSRTQPTTNPASALRQPQDPAAAPSGRPRASSLQQSSQPRPAPAPQPTASSGAPRAPGALPRLPTSAATQAHARTSSAPAPQSIPTAAAGAETGQPQSQARTSNVSSFPHAFERWETLSSHWEGLTSYWIRRLEANRDDVRREPLAQQMSRQITDLSAAGANLFHAVVELQRLRASSERKFQRWFFETRQEQERMQETHAEMQRALAAEQRARQEAEKRADKAERERHSNGMKHSEMQRELQISKEEARRAWEELGRREQEERERTVSLRDGVPIFVGGVQVVPMQPVGSRQGSISQRPTTRERAAAEQDPQMRQQFSYEEQSPTDTDPYASAAARGAASQLRHEPDAPAMGQAGYATYPSGSTPATSSSTHTAIPADKAPTPLRTQNIPTSQPQSSQGPPPTSEPSSPEAFYTHAGTYLTPGGQPSSQPQTYDPPAVSEPDDGQSYVPSIEGESEVSEEGYEIDAHGNYVLDARGNPIPYRPPRHSVDSSNDSYDVQAELERERDHAQRYGGGRGNYPATTTAGAGPSGGGQRPDYEGQGYGTREYDQWAGMQRHHHPTRLSDVLEEDERSRTSPSRNSQVSRGVGR